MELQMTGNQLWICHKIISQKNYEIGFRDRQSMIQGAGAAVLGNLVVTNMIDIRAELFHELPIGGMTNGLDHDYLKLSAGKSLPHHPFQPELFASAKFMDGTNDRGSGRNGHSQSMRNFNKPRAADSPPTRSSSSA